MKMKIKIRNKLIIQQFPNSLDGIIRQRLTFDNPVWLENERMGRWNGETPRVLKFYKVEGECLILPRGFARQLIGLCRDHDVGFEILDQRRTLPEVGFKFNGRLKPFQAEAVGCVLSRDFGTLQAPTGSGKTVMALYVIAEREQPTLIVAHSKELLHQWVDRIGRFLGIPKDEIGQIGDGKKIIGEKVTVAIVNSLYKWGAEVAPHIGFLIVDECHRCPSRTFIEAVSAFDSRYMLGLSATPWRRDKLTRLIYWYLGDRAHAIEPEALQESGDILRAEVIQRETDFRTYLDASEEYSSVLSEITEDTERNALIVSDVAKETNNGGGVCLILSDRKGHCKALYELLKGRGIKSQLLTGDVGNGKRQEIVQKVNSGQVKALVATGQLIGEGFDCKDLSTLFLTTPIKFDGRVLQYLGRVLRPARGKKKARVFDYVDSNVGVLRASAKARQRVIS